jgi:hypothetical protein
MSGLPQSSSPKPLNQLIQADRAGLAREGQKAGQEVVGPMPSAEAAEELSAVSVLNGEGPTPEAVRELVSGPIARHLLDDAAAAIREDLRATYPEHKQAIVHSVNDVLSTKAEDLVHALRAEDHRVSIFISGLVVEILTIAFDGDAAATHRQNEVGPKASPRRFHPPLGNNRCALGEAGLNRRQEDFFNRAFGFELGFHALTITAPTGKKS